MKKITYILGAGASANCLPVVSTLNRDMELFLEYMKVTPFPTADIELFTNELGSLLNEVFSHQTIDTLAKKYFLTKDWSSLSRLKAILSIYLTYAQFSKEFNIFKNDRYIYPDYPRTDNKLDPPVFSDMRDLRYDSFFASLLVENDGKLRLPENIKVITWNYDNQLEQAYGKYFNAKNFREVYGSLGTIFHEEDYQENVSIVHLNGLAGHFNIPQSMFYDDTLNIEADHLPDKFQNLISQYAKEFKIADKSLNFAWENESSYKVKVARKIIKGTHILVVIGYSFPFFNRAIDRILFNALKTDETHWTLQKIYFQDKLLKGEFLMEQFGLPESTVQILPYSNVNQFFLPPEL